MSKAAQQTIHIVFDGPPSHESGRFIEVENSDGYSIGIGEWKERKDGFWELVIPTHPQGMNPDAIADVVAALRVISMMHDGNPSDAMADMPIADYRAVIMGEMKAEAKAALARLEVQS